MLVYEGTKADFIYSVENDTIAYEIETKLLEALHRHTAKNEFRSWENSLEYMYKVLNDPIIPYDTGIAIEYNIPQTSKRVDFLISGYNKNNKGNVIIVELKQWSEIQAVDSREALVETFTGNQMRKVVHPSYQAWSYAQLIKDYNESVRQDDIQLHPCAYLHNYRRIEEDPIDQNQYQIYLEEAPVFTRGQVSLLREFIKEKIVHGDHGDLLYRIENGKIKPSKSLQNEIASMLRGNQEFVLIDEQKVVYEEILNISRKTMDHDKKSVIIVEGGPGTGKSVLAINLLSKLTNEDQFCQYVSKNSAPRTVYLEKLKGEMRKSSIDNLFKGSGIYCDMNNNILDTLLVDEAHRLNEKSGIYHNKGENQIKEIIHAAKCSVFFIDESQRVTLQDIGSVDEIRKWATYYNANVYQMELISQFRCNGSDGYLAWLDHILQIRETANYDLMDIDYDICICDTPQEVKDLIFEKNEINHRSRMLAGYCWNWISQGKNDSNIHDIQIGDFEMSWNLGNSIFAIDESSIHEIGCIHTSQGLEFDYVGVIIGNDLRFENGKIITDYNQRASTDQSMKGIKKMAKENPEKANKIAEEIIKNTYRTLMTRGMKGCYIYCVDKNLSDYLKNCVETSK